MPTLRPAGAFFIHIVTGTFHLGNVSPQSFINLYLPVVSFHFEIKDSGPVEHADFETDATSSSTIVEDDDES
jgi:hypothetical protein